MSSPDLLRASEVDGWFALLQAHSNLSRRLDAVLWRAHRLSLGAHTVLFRMAWAGGELRMSQVAETMLLSPSGASRLVDRLVADGLVERRACDSDGRAVHAQITERGRERLAASRPTYEAELRSAFTGQFSAAEYERLTELLLRLAPQCPRTAGRS